MTEIILYQFLSEDFHKSLCKLIDVAHRKNPNDKIFILCNTKEECIAIDKNLWSFQQLSFIPHMLEWEQDAKNTSIIIGMDIANIKNFNIVICINNNNIQVATQINCHKLILTYSSNTEENENYYSKAVLSLSDITNVLRYEQNIDGSWLKIEQ